MKDPLKYVRPNIRGLQPYSTARDEFKGGDISVWLDANESPYDNDGLNRYPDPHQKELKRHIAAKKGIAADCIFVGGAGSDEAIDLTFRIFCTPGVDNAVAIAPSYGVYKVAASINDVELREVMLGDGYSLPVDDLLAAADDRTKLIWICSPNNPTGNAFSPADIARLAEEFDGMVVVDEAYVDFSSKGSVTGYIERYPNLIVLQTFSKAWGLASLRVGMAFATPDIARIYGMVKYPYNVNGPTQLEIIKRLSGDIASQVSEILKERDMLMERVRELKCTVEVYPSDANFILVKVLDADSLYDYLISRGIIVRNRSRVKGCECTLRITVGTPSENEKLLNALKDYNDGCC